VIQNVVDEQTLLALTSKLRRLAKLDTADEQAIRGIDWSTERVGANHHLIREGSQPADYCVLIQGFACRYKIMAGGSRQIVSFHVAGDILDLQHLYLASADHHVQAITRATVAWVPKSQLRKLVEQRPPISEALWKDALIDASIFREWVLNVGRRDAKARIAHMLCEFVWRCQDAGLGHRRQFRLPLTQDQIADATGLTPEHVNRTMKTLASEGALEGGGRSYRVKSWSRLQSAGGFDRAYLHVQAA
jgi:CRP-like cAMP-binding protein